LGRTEDVRFSPNNRRLAIPNFTRNSIAVLDVDIGIEGNRPRVTVTGATDFAAPGLAYPHGVDFLDDETIVVANRDANITAYRFPSRDDVVDGARLTPIDPPPGRGSTS
jgi:hypothetical protein